MNQKSDTGLQRQVAIRPGHGPSKEGIERSFFFGNELIDPYLIFTLVTGECVVLENIAGVNRLHDSYARFLIIGEVTTSFFRTSKVEIYFDTRKRTGNVKFIQ